jgi:5-methylcytosine-specific restriction protein A
VLVKGGRCPAHSTKRVERDPAVKRLYNSRQWKAMRAAQLAAHPWCAKCSSSSALVMASEVDHITPHNGDPILFFDASNLQSLCKPHHSLKTSEEVWRV